MRSLAFLLLISLATISSQANADEDTFWRHRLGGFDGLVLRCESSGAEMFEEVCRRVAIDFDFLTATASIKSIDCTECNWAQYYADVAKADIEYPLEVFVRIASTDDPNYVGGFAEVIARADLADYVCVTTSTCGASLTNPDVNLLHNFFTFTANLNSTSPENLSEPIEGHLKALITRYVKARKDS